MFPCVASLVNLFNEMCSENIYRYATLLSISCQSLYISIIDIFPELYIGIIDILLESYDDIIEIESRLYVSIINISPEIMSASITLNNLIIGIFILLPTLFISYHTLDWRAPPNIPKQQTSHWPMPDKKKPIPNGRQYPY